MCYVRMQFTKRQQTQPDNAYTKKEEIMHKIAGWFIRCCGCTSFNSNILKKEARVFLCIYYFFVDSF